MICFCLYPHTGLQDSFGTTKRTRDSLPLQLHRVKDNLPGPQNEKRKHKGESVPYEVVVSTIHMKTVCKHPRNGGRIRSIPRRVGQLENAQRSCDQASDDQTRSIAPKHIGFCKLLVTQIMNAL